MGYNTRRKSLSLTELGITLPKRQRTQSHPSPPSTIAEGDESERPSKKSRLMSPPAIKEKSKPISQLSPPPSPAREGSNKVDVEGISDDIVVGTIQQLEQTGNRPHLVKELATILATNLHSVEKSANPSALISSRLTSYLNRPWPTVSPCPLAKDLSPIHPRRLYFFLTTLPRQPIPETVEPPKIARIISPSLSSASAIDEEEPRFSRDRHALSPSPEVDLSSPELEDNNTQEPPTPGAPFSGRNSIARDRSESTSTTRHPGRRGGSPQLEHEERDFKQTANALFEQAQQRRNSQQSQSQSQQDVNMDAADTTAGAEQERAVSVARSIEEETQELEFHSSEDVTALFGHASSHLKLLDHEGMGMEMFSSPLIQPLPDLEETEVGLGASRLGRENEEVLEAMHLDHQLENGGKMLGLEIPELADWETDTLRSPEKIDVAELEDMFDAY
ncbi:hypothetical protein LTR09_009520 [Extremus antarcticus]|uniref:GDS1 winged helix domain-containing protein n=1 Tax=Extremus antarcticus TaxID=702011 RepID=A0AAJ0DFG5_9PEZI|nr:hypothetical protein LTR09_009520 [Extremus antarcticus]